jgi:hypothetical protein
MAPIGAFTRPKGEHVIVHRCLGCGFERYCRIAADDDFDLVLALPVVEARSQAARAQHADHKPDAGLLCRANTPCAREGADTAP